MNKKTSPSPQQARLLEFLKTYIAEKGYPPSLRDMANHMELKSTTGVRVMLFALEKKGWITREKKTARTTRITK
jgi:repressor LexA